MPKQRQTADYEKLKEIDYQWVEELVADIQDYEAVLNVTAEIELNSDNFFTLAVHGEESIDVYRVPVNDRKITNEIIANLDEFTRVFAQGEAEIVCRWEALMSAITDYRIISIAPRVL